MIFACPFCNAKSDPDRSDCVSCGRLISRPCPHCAEEISVDASACKYCGDKTGPAPLPAEASVEGIRFLEEPARSTCCRPGFGARLVLVLGILAALAAALSMRSTCPSAGKAKAPAVEHSEPVESAPRNY